MASSTEQFRPLTKAEENMVHDVWYGDRAKFGRKRTYELVKAKYGDRFTGSQRAILDYLKKQPQHQKFNRGLRKTTVKPYSNKRRGMICFDTIDMERDAFRQFKAILVGIDAYTRYLSAEPLKDKTSAETARALKAMVRKRPNRTFSVAVSDNGGEFTGPEFQRALRDLNIPKHVTTAPHSPWANGISERAVQTVVRQIYQNMDDGHDKNWPALLDTVCGNYNRTTQASTNQIPAKLEETAEDADVHVTAGDFIAKKLGRRFSGAEGQDLPVGAKVRTKVINEGRLYKPNRSGYFNNSELFTVVGKAKTRWNQLGTYKLRRENGQVVDHNFPRWQLLLVSLPERGVPDRNGDEGPANVINGEDDPGEEPGNEDEPRRSLRQQGEYEVQYIWGKKKQGRKVLWRVKWVGYPVSESTWEPSANLKNARDAICEYEAGRP